MIVQNVPDRGGYYLGGTQKVETIIAGIIGGAVFGLTFLILKQWTGAPSGQGVKIEKSLATVADLSFSLYSSDYNALRGWMGIYPTQAMARLAFVIIGIICAAAL